MQPKIGGGDLPPPRLSPQLRALIKAQLTEVPVQAEQVVQAIRSSIDDYSNIDASIVEDLRRTVQFNLGLWYRSLISREMPVPEALGEALTSAQRRVSQHISLTALLRAYRIGSRTFWAIMLDAARKDPALHEEMLFSVSPYLLYYFDVISQSVASSFNTEQSRQTRWQDRLRHELCAIVFNTPENAEGFRSQTQALGLDAAAPHTVLALQLDTPLIGLTEFDERMETLLAAVARILRVGRDQFLHSLRNDHLLYWLPLLRGEAPLAHEQRLLRQAGTILESGLREVRAAGLGLSGQGASGWRLSAQQAMKAIDLGARLTGGRSVRLYTDIALDDAVLGSEETARYFDVLLERISVEVGLLETLNVYFNLGQRRKAVAGALGVHPNTLDYRLHRIEVLLGASLSDTDWLVKLHTALRLRRLRSALRPG